MIAVPPLEVQHEIVNILDTFEEHIECLKKELELKELLNERQSHRQHIPNVGKQMFKQQLALVETLEKWIIDFENSLKEQN